MAGTNRRTLPFLASLLFVGAVATPPDIQKHPTCGICGMDREAFGYSRILVAYDDGASFGACSLRCAAIDMIARLDKTPVAVSVGDYGTRALIDADRAFWIIGGSEPGVMTDRAKWAFASEKDALTFRSAKGGTLAGFDEAMTAAFTDLYAEIKSSRERAAERRREPGS
jgi:nitrous oxide reductase accessory protein NosL